MTNKNCSWTDEWGKRTYPWSGSRCSSFLLKSKLAHVSDTRSSNQQKCQRGHRLRAWIPCAKGLETRLAAAAKGGAREWAESCEEWNGETIKPSPINFPTLPCSFLYCRFCSHCPSHYTEIFSFASNWEAVTQLWSKPGMHRRSNLCILSKAFQNVHFLQSLQTWH